MNDKQHAGRVLVVGGGMAGLAAGCYAQMNGYETHIFERHEIAGGLCTAWTRQGFTFDISLHFLSCALSGKMKRMWDELGITQGRTFKPEDGGVVEVGDVRFVWHRDLDMLEAEMLALSPADAPLIKELIDAGRATSAMDFFTDKPSQLWGLGDMLRFFVGERRLILMDRKWGKVSVAEYAKRFQHPVLRRVIGLFAESTSWSMPDCPMTALLFMLGMRHTGNAARPMGGSFNVAQTVAKRFTELGGTLHLKALVEQIIVENDRAVGLRLADGSEMRGDHVVAAGDGRRAIWNLLGARYMSDALARLYRDWRVVQPLVMVLMGVDRDFAGEPYTQSLELPAPISVCGEARERMDVIHYGFDPGMAPAGKSVVQVWYGTNWDYWQALAQDRDRYEAEKLEIAQTVIDALEQRWPGFKQAVEVVDVPTPITYHRYTLNEQGSPDGWCITTTNSHAQAPVTLPGLSNFYMAGQWTMPFSGVPGAAMSGRNAVQLLCHADKRAFQTSLPPAGWGPVDVKPKDKPETRRGTGRKAPPPAPVSAALPAPAPAAALLRHATVDAERCDGCGDCVTECPQVFALGEDGRAYVCANPLWPEVEEAVRRALTRCPDGAIQVCETATVAGTAPV